MINSAVKRRASISFGFVPAAGTLIPNGVSTAFRRGSGLSLYSPVTIVVDLPIVDGWSFGGQNRTWKLGPQERLMTFAASRVWKLRRRR